MSKSLGNFFTVRDLLDQGYPGEVIRFVLLSTQYSKPMDWTLRKAEEAEATLRKWRGIIAGVEQVDEVSPKVVKAVADDLNTAGAMTALHKIAANDPAVLQASARLLGLLSDDLGGWDQAGGDAAARIEALLAERVAARAAKDFARADAIRDAFNAAGVEVRDGAEGATWSLLPGFDASRLEGV
jgi:cysteinyl-tRNA synthetase